MPTLGSTIRELREKMNLTQTELADELRFSKSIIWTYELDKKEPSLLHLKAIADYFDVSVDYLLDRDSGGLTSINLSAPVQKVLEEYQFIVDENELSKEEIEEAILYVRARRIMKREN